MLMTTRCLKVQQLGLAGSLDLPGLFLDLQDYVVALHEPVCSDPAASVTLIEMFALPAVIFNPEPDPWAPRGHF